MDSRFRGNDSDAVLANHFHWSIKTSVGQRLASAYRLCDKRGTAPSTIPLFTLPVSPCCVPPSHSRSAMRAVVGDLVADCRATSPALAGQLHATADAEPLPHEPYRTTMQALDGLLWNPPKPDLDSGVGSADCRLHGWLCRDHSSKISSPSYAFRLFILRLVVLLPEFLILLPSSPVPSTRCLSFPSQLSRDKDSLCKPLLIS